MIQEDYISFETAKLLKEKGFEPPHDYRKCIPIMYTDNGEIKWGVWSDDWYPRITFQMAMKWLREVHKIDITVDPHEVGNNWIYEFHICQNKDYLFSRDVDTSYENCAKAAIKYCLENLI